MVEKKLWRLSDVTLRDVRKIGYQAAVLPFGATEPHNLHLPYATDNIEVTAIAERACAWAWERGGKVALLPTIPLGCDQNMAAFPMTISVDQQQLDGIVESVAKSLERHGVMKLVVLNGHGGNEFKGGLRTLYGRSKVFCSVVNFYQVAKDLGKKIFENSGDHADEMETSLVMELAPHLVENQHADDGAVLPSRFQGALDGWVWYPRPFDRLTTNSGAGNPKAASAEKGRKYLQAIEERLGQYLVELSNSKMDDIFPFKKG